MEKMPADTSDYGMHYDTRHAKIIARAQAVSKDKWSALPIKILPAQTPLSAHLETIERRDVDKVVNRDVPLRENYPTHLWRDDNGKLYVVDGHVRAAIYYTLDKPMPVRIMNEHLLDELGDDEDKEI